MCTFDQALFDLYNTGSISYDEAIRNADSANELRLQIKLRGTRAQSGQGAAGGLNLVMDAEQEEEAAEAK